VNQECKQLQIGDSLKTSDVIANLITSGITIDKTDNQSLEENIRYCMALIGLRETPTQMETMVLFDFIRSNYRFFHPEEIKIAFQLGVKGDLNCDMNNYGAFSPLYFGKVMNAYRTFREKASIELERKRVNEGIKPIQQTPESLAQIENEFRKTVIDPIFERYKYTGKLIFEVESPALVKSVYQSLIEKSKVIVFTKEEKQAIKNEAELSMAFYETPKRKNIFDTSEEPTEEQIILTLCHKECILKAFEKMMTL